MIKFNSKSMHGRKHITQSLINWYDLNGRSLPWRSTNNAVGEKKKYDPYLIWISEIMLQQTTVSAVKPYFIRFSERWPTVFDLASAEEEEVYSMWAGLGYYSRAKNLIRSAKIIVEHYHGNFPSSVEKLLELPGIGPYTSAAIASIAFNKRATVVDTNVERVIARVFSLQSPVKEIKEEIFSIADQLTPKSRPGDYAQAIMDLGATVCKPTAPTCNECPLNDICDSLKKNIVHLIPKRRIRKEKPVRYGSIYVATKSSNVILYRRPSKGLLPNMLCPPTFGWLDDRTQKGPPFEACWEATRIMVYHSFTHFNLILKVYKSEIGETPTGYTSYPLTQKLIGSLPSLVRKVLDSVIKG